MRNFIEGGQSRVKRALEALRQTSLARTVTRKLRRIGPEHIDTTRIHGSIYSADGTLLIESPELQRATQAEQADITRRVRYFPSQVPTDQRQSLSGNILNRADNELHAYLFFNNIGIGANLFNQDYVVPPLEEYLRHRYANRDIIGIRGTACAIEEGVFVEGNRILTAAEIISQGIENGRDHAAMTGFHPKGDPHYDAQIGHRSVQWLISHPQDIRKAAIAEGNTDAAGKIFPLLVVYDRSRFPEGTTILPSDPQERSQCVLEALILDYPIPMSEADWSERRRAHGR